MTDICLINTHFPPYVSGGAENYVHRVAKSLQRTGYDVSVIATKPYDGMSSLRPEQSTYDGINVHYFYPLNISHKSEGTGEGLLSKGIWHQIDTLNIHSGMVLSELLEDIDPDIIHTHNLMGISTLIGKPISKHPARHVHTVHDYSLICPKSNLLRERTANNGEVAVCENPPAPCKMFKSMKKRTFVSPDIVTAPSRHVLNVHKKHGYFEDTPCQRLQLGIEGPVVDSPTEADNTSILFVGKHLRAKGLDTLYPAAAVLPEVTFDICGTGPCDDRAKEQAKKQDNVVYHGYVDDERLEELRKAATVGIVPSIWMENSPLTIYESFAYGLPVIGSNIGGIPELIKDGKTGWLFPPGDSDELVKVIKEKVLENDIQDIRMNIVEWAQHQTIDSHVDTLLHSIYEQ